jgi:hypothetical protein
MEFKIVAHHEDGFVYGHIELTNGEMKYTFNLGSMIGPVSVKEDISDIEIPYVEFLEKLRNREKSKFVVQNMDVPLWWIFKSDTDGYLTINADNDNIYNVFKIRIKMTNEIFAEMEKLIITTKRRKETPEETAEWEEQYFPKDYVYGRGLAYG